MNENFLYDLLIDPLTGESLVFDNALQTLKGNLSGHSYRLIESVPEIITGDNPDIARSDIHRIYNSYFNYHDHYQKDADNFDYSEMNIPEVTRSENNRLHQSIIHEIPGDLSVVLDVGCGNGWISKELIPLGKKVISMDISSTNPVNAVRGVRHKNHAGLIADAYNIPLMENSVDCIVASEILEHVPDPGKFIANLIKLLRKEGKLIITTPYNEKIEYFLCVHCNRLTPKHAHLHSFNEVNIKMYIPQTGTEWTCKKLINKWLSRIRSHILLNPLPFRIWKSIDNIFNRIFKNPVRLQIVITKT